jgi:hypothetical protein
MIDGQFGRTIQRRDACMRWFAKCGDHLPFVGHRLRYNFADCGWPFGDSVLALLDKTTFIEHDLSSLVVQANNHYQILIQKQPLAEDL